MVRTCVLPVKDVDGVVGAAKFDKYASKVNPKNCRVLSMLPSPHTSMQTEQMEEIEDSSDTNDDEAADSDANMSDGREENDDGEGHLIVSLPPTKNDIFCGRGKGIGSKPGNEKYIKLISSKRADYLKLPKKEKQCYAKQVLKEIEMWSPPGRFLEYPVGHGQDGDEKWKTLSTKRIIVKICTALRKGPECNDGRKRAQAARRQSKIQELERNRSKIISWKTNRATERKRNQDQKAPVTAREEEEAGGEREADTKRAEDFDGKSPYSPQRLNKRPLPSSSGTDARRVAQKTAQKTSSFPKSSSFSPLSSKEQRDQQGDRSCSSSSKASNEENKEVRSSNNLSSECKRSPAIPLATPSSCFGSSTSTAADSKTPQGVHGVALGNQSVATFPRPYICGCGGIVGSVAASLTLLVGVTPPECICSQILASQILFPSSSLSMLGVPNASFSGLCLPPHPNPVSAIAFPSTLFATVPQTHQGDPLTTPKTMTQELCNRPSVLQAAYRRIDGPNQTIPMIHNGMPYQTNQRSLAAALLLQAATQREATAATTFEDSSSTQPMWRSASGTPRVQAASTSNVPTGTNDDEKIKEAPEAVASSPAKGTKSGPLSPDPKNALQSSDAQKSAFSFPHRMRDPLSAAKCASSPVSPFQEEQKSMLLRRCDNINGPLSEASGSQSARPAPVVSCVHGTFGTDRPRVNTTCTREDDGKIHAEANDVFGNADEDRENSFQY